MYFIILFAHAMINRERKKKQKTKAFYRKLEASNSLPVFSNKKARKSL